MSSVSKKQPPRFIPELHRRLAELARRLMSQFPGCMPAVALSDGGNSYYFVPSGASARVKESTRALADMISRDMPDIGEKRSMPGRCFDLSRDTRLCDAGPPFPLLDLPDAALASILSRLPGGSVAGFPLPLVLAQVRLTGSVDPNWLGPLLHVATRCPTVLGRLARDLREIPIQSTEAIESFLERPIQSTEVPCIKKLRGVAGQLTRLEALRVDHFNASLLMELPTGLTRLSFGHVIGQRPVDWLSSPLARLTKLEELELDSLFSKGGAYYKSHWSLGACCPQLRRLRCSQPPLDAEEALPNLLDLEAHLESKDLPRLRLPKSLTRLFCCESSSALSSLAALSGLVNLRDLGFHCKINEAELPDLLGALTGLTRLELGGIWKVQHLNYLVEALERGPKDLGLWLSDLDLQSSYPTLDRLFRHLVEAEMWLTSVQVPWATLTRLTRLALRVDGNQNPSWIQALSQLPSLGDLNLTLTGQIPAGLKLLTQCTTLKLEKTRSTANLSELRGLTRLREVYTRDSRLDCVAWLPDCLTLLVSSVSDSFIRSYGWWGTSTDRAIQRLTALERLSLSWPEYVDEVVDLSPLKRLTYLWIGDIPCSMARLGPMPCLQYLKFNNCAMRVSTSADGLLRQIEDMTSLRDLNLYLANASPITDAKLAPLSRLSMLKRLEIVANNSISAEGLRSLLDLPLMEDLRMLVYSEQWQDPGWDELLWRSEGRLHIEG